ncbi:ADP-ribose pyrophosphatase, mitochondrial isoform X2 [Microcaecilia unicolor]|uniref:ADP-ribose pyrophosphatase, mitochondrial n=1 Tax=Microcaecilia unicolor TaxID=1415580 RepID=A0A6P7XIA4_9AMPH|nr:ADP-ribose pyrophosphatase, mitochondrial isoform X2 [Microcaecilia unicolor]
MSRRGLVCAITAVSLTVTLSTVIAARSSTCRPHQPLYTIFREQTCSMSGLHNKARTSPYPGSQIMRAVVPDDKVCWSVSWPEYKPVEYTVPAILAQPVWADPPIGEMNFSPKFNELDGKVQRKSLNGPYLLENGQPRNPTGRTGIAGRGLLGRWGPNHAADPIITRWKRDGNGTKQSHSVSGKHILQFVAIKRRDCGEWAIPGGMVDPGEKISITLKREFGEEALNSLQKSRAERQKLEEQLQQLFSQDHFVAYRGYVDDPRNTDNAWMETEAVNYHDDSGKVMDEMPLEAGDDAGKVKWVDIKKQLQLYASHAHFLQLVAEHRGAHWC